MGRFESPLQVVGLFLAASVVSVGVIFFVNAEAHSRLSSAHHHHSNNNHPVEKEHYEPPVSLPLHSSSSPNSSYLTQEDKAAEEKESLQNNIINRNNNNIKDNNGEVNAVAPADSISTDVVGSTRSVEINDASLPGLAAASSSSVEPSSPSFELTKSSMPPPTQKASKLSSYSAADTFSSLVSSASPSLLMADNNGSNVTLLNFLEDGLEKLLSLIKQAKNTYKSYYKRKKQNKKGQEHEEEEVKSSEVMEVAPRAKYADNDIITDSGASSNITSGSLGGHNNYRRKSRRRRKKREVGQQEKVMSVMTMITNGNTSESGRSVGRRSKRAVISALTANGNNGGRRGRRIGENEPYYWQMLEDNNNDQQQHHHHAHNQRNNNNHHNQNAHYSQYSHYSSQQHNHNHHKQQQHAGGGASSGLYSGYGASPAVASAFTAPGKGASGGESGTNGAGISISSPTSDFHKIRHAMNKLGGGGLDISVVERMILDTKSSRPGMQQSKDKEPPKSGPPKGWGYQQTIQNGRDGRVENSLGNVATAALLTTATTKTTQAGRQDEGLYVNQLRHQKQQLAQSLLPPTVTWLGNNGEPGGDVARFLPLPASSRATGYDVDEDDDVDEDNDDSDEDSNNESRIGSGGDQSNEVDNEAGDSNENSVDSLPKRQGNIKRKKGKKQKSRKNNELSYSKKSPIIEKDDEENAGSRSTGEEQDSDYLPYDVRRKEKEQTYSSSSEEDAQREKHNNDNSDNNSGSSDDHDNNSNEDDDDEDIAEHDDDRDDEEVEDDEILLGGESGKQQQQQQNNRKRKNKKGAAGSGDNSGSTGEGKTGPHQQQDCYHTDDVLIVVAITCCLNFAFVLVIWALVRWFSISSNPKEKDFQNLGDCDDTLDPTIVFHGVAEDPCWTLAGSGKDGTTTRGGGQSSGGEGMLSRRNCDEGGLIGSGAGGPGTIRSIHSVAGNKLDLFPTMGGKLGGGGIVGAATLQNSSMLEGRAGGIGATVMTMTMDRSSRGAYHNGYLGTGASNGILGMGGGGIGSSFVMNGMYSFRPEHVPTHHNTASGSGMVRSYSQSMEDLRYIQ